MIWYIIAIIISLHNVAIAEEIICPTNCICDMKNNLRRAKCSNLINKDAGVPDGVELLDLSHNQIPNLEDDAFFEYMDLQILNISHNKISSITIGAFNGLIQLKIIDLSHNYLFKIEHLWFSMLPLFQELYLSGNIFTDAEYLQIESKTLRVLDLSNCLIDRLPNDIFEKIPKLEILDLSDNKIFQLSTDLFMPLRKLFQLSFSSTYYYNQCTSEAHQKLQNYTKIHNINYLNSCLTNTTNKKSFWLYYDQQFNTSSKKQNIIQCDNESDENSDEKDSGFFMNIFTVSPFLNIVILVALTTFGFLWGCLIGSNLEVKSVECPLNTRPIRKIRRKAQCREETDIILLSSVDLSTSTPMTQRRNVF